MGIEWRSNGLNRCLTHGDLMGGTAVLLEMHCTAVFMVPETPYFLYDPMICCMDMLNSVFPGERLTSQALCAVLMFVESPSIIID